MVQEADQEAYPLCRPCLSAAAAQRDFMKPLGVADLALHGPRCAGRRSAAHSKAYRQISQLAELLQFVGCREGCAALALKPIHVLQHLRASFKNCLASGDGDDTCLEAEATPQRPSCNQT